MTHFLAFAAGVVCTIVVRVIFHRIDDDDWEQHRDYDED